MSSTVWAVLFTMLFLLALAVAGWTEHQLCPRCRQRLRWGTCPACGYQRDDGDTARWRWWHP